MRALIQQAAQQLEQIRAAGIEIPESESASQQPAAADPAPEAGSAIVDRGISIADAPVSSKQVELDLDALVSAGYVVRNAPRTRVADQFRVIKRPLIDNANAKG